MPPDSSALPQEMFTPQAEGDDSVNPPSTPDAKPEQQPETPPAAPAAPAESQPKTYKLGDREVDADTLYKEYTENLLPDYTRKSQKLAEYERPKQDPQDINNSERSKPKWQDPNWVPQTYEEILQAAEERITMRAEAEAQAQEEQKALIKSTVDTELAEVKKLEPNIDENVLFQHANKYGFTNLPSAYQNMKDMQTAIKSTQAETLKNLKTRENDPVSGGSGEAASEGVDYRAIQGRSVYDAARDHFERIKGN